MTRRAAAFLLLASQLLFGLACFNEGEEPDPTTVKSDLSDVDTSALGRCPDPRTGAPRATPVVAADRPFTWRILAASETLSCTCERTSTPQWGCDRQKICTSSYDLGAENPSRCEVIGRKRADAVSDAWRDDGGPASCETDVRVASRDEGIIEVTATCPAGDHSFRIAFVTDGGERVATLFVAATPGGECRAD